MRESRQPLLTNQGLGPLISLQGNFSSRFVWRARSCLLSGKCAIEPTCGREFEYEYEDEDEDDYGTGQTRSFEKRVIVVPTRPIIVLVLELVLIVGPKLFIEPGAKAFFLLSSVSDP